MANYKVILEVTVSYSIVVLCHLSVCTFPLKVSPVVVKGNSSNVCLSQNEMDAEVNATKEKIQQAIIDIINVFLDQGKASPEFCANTTGWTRVAFLNMSEPDEICPSNLILRTLSSVRGCERQSSGSELQSSSSTFCDSTFFNLHGQRYSSVCGRVLAYQIGSPDAFDNYLFHDQRTINSVYVDGVSLTYGPAESRQHIWTFAASVYEEDHENNTYSDRDNCFCTNTQYSWPYVLPSFVGNNYFCDTGNPGPGWEPSRIYSADPLWDGKGCGPFNTCCQFNNPPWFHTTLPQNTSDNIELRLCQDEDPRNEDIILNLVEIYVK